MTKLRVNDYLSVHGCEARDSDQLYESGFINYIRVAAVGDSIFIRSQCCAEMRKGVSYVIDAKLTDTSCIQESQCECAAGVGPSAHCKHVKAVLFSMHEFTVNGKLNLKLACTQKLQSFHRSKPYLGSPVKAEGLKLGKGARTDHGELHGVHFDPRPSTAVSHPGYTSYVRNTTINFLASQDHPISIPLSQMYKPANIFALESDHDYCGQTLSEQFVQNLGVTRITHEQAAKIEEVTRGQASNVSWHMERCLRLQASKFGRICKSQNRQKLAQELVTLKRVNAAAVRHGRKYEDHALNEFAECYGVTIERSGIVVSVERPYIAGSPDGLCDVYLLEVKCPYAARHKQINPETVPYLYLDEHTGLYTLDSAHDYYYQIQGLMYITGKSQCCFLVYTLCDRYEVIIPRDDDFIHEMCVKLDVFLKDVYRNLVLDRFLYRIK